MRYYEKMNYYKMRNTFTSNWKRLEFNAASERLPDIDLILTLILCKPFERLWRLDIDGKNIITWKSIAILQNFF